MALSIILTLCVNTCFPVGNEFDSAWFHCITFRLSNKTPFKKNQYHCSEYTSDERIINLKTILVKQNNNF